MWRVGRRGAGLAGDDDERRVESSGDVKRLEWGDLYSKPGHRHRLVCAFASRGLPKIADGAGIGGRPSQVGAE